MSDVMMKCGHSANAVVHEKDGSSRPCCAICWGNPEADIVDNNPPDLTNRIAKCHYCGLQSPSKVTLPFFEYKPKAKFDHYYCGCWGWD